VGGLVDRLTRAALRRGVREGLLGRDGRWLVAGAGALLVRVLMKRPEPSVVVEQLRPGESLLVTNIGPQRGRAARRARRRGEAVSPPLVAPAAPGAAD
jgi:hypothetical protein